MTLTAASKCDTCSVLPEWFVLSFSRFQREGYTGMLLVNCHKGTPGSIERMKERITEKYVFFS